MLPVALIVAADAPAPEAAGLPLAPPLAPALAPALEGAVLSLAPLLAAGALWVAADDGAVDAPWLLLHAMTSNESATRLAPPERRMRIESPPGRPCGRSPRVERGRAPAPGADWSGCPVWRAGARSPESGEGCGRTARDTAQRDVANGLQRGGGISLVRRG